jgi:putative ABC transport system substrate-binding protein
VPAISRVAVLVNPANTSITATTEMDVGAAARARGLQIQIYKAGTGREIDSAFAIIMRERPDALFVASDPYFTARRIQIVQYAAQCSIPATYGARELSEVGGMMSYGTSVTDGFRQVGVYAGRILKGAKPADLPVVQASKFELVINNQTARMLGLTVPDKLLVAADEVIE